jgi:outer membrane protein assembly factor BamB
MHGRFLCVPVFMAGFSLGAVEAGDWAQFLGPGRNGVSLETGLRLPWGRQGPPLIWEKQVGAGFAGPVVRGDRLILFHRLDNDEVVACLDCTNGKELWSHKYPTGYRDDFGFDEGPRSTPLIDGERVFTLGAEGQLCCLELTTGKLVWSRSILADYKVRKGFFGVGTSPLVEDGNVLVNVGGPGAGIVAFQKETGKEVWRATNHEASYSSPAVTTVNGRRRAVFLTREGIVIVDPRDGSVSYTKHWRARGSASVNAATPIVVDNHVFVSASYGTGAILLLAAKERMEEIWSGDETLSNHYTTSIAHEGYLYGFDGRQEEGARLRCVEMKTGKVAWSVDSFGCGSMIFADGHLIILHEKGGLILAVASPAAYREEVRVALMAGPCRSPLALAKGRLYARDTKRLVCWDLRK